MPAEEILGDARIASFHPGGGEGVPIWFQPVPEGKSVKNRVHLDLQVSRGREESRAERRASIELVVARFRPAVVR